MLQPGTLLDERYRILSILGEGGMGIVYKAQDTVLETTLALKTLLPQLRTDTEAKRDLGREVALCQKLAHPHIVHVYHLETRGEIPYMTMEYVDGITLAEHKARRERLPLEEVLRIFHPILSALAYAHAKGIVHRDIKPQNIMIAADGEVKVMDFGIAQVLKDTYTKLTGSPVSGTVYYMAPEHIRGKRPDARSDIYALGCMFYELVNGKPPFWTGDVVWQQLNEQPEPLESVPPALNGALLRCLEKDPARRPQTVVELAAGLGLQLETHAPSGRVSAPVAEPTPGRTVKLDEGGYRAAAASAAGGRASASSGREAPRAAQPVELPDPQSAARPSAGESRSGGVMVSLPSPLKRYLPLLGVLGAVLVLLIGWALWKGYEGLENERRQMAAKQEQEERHAERRRQVAERSDEVVDLGDGVSLGLKRIPAGSFQMGASSGDSEAENDEKPAHRVTISREFYMGVTEVTQAQWRAVMGTNPSRFWGDNRPVEQVSWEDAVAFCEKLSQRTGQKYRLPTEAEWEYAARAGTTTAYYWGSSMDGDYAWYTDNSGHQTHPVGQKLKNGWGLYDMSGNVWEWCADWYDADYYGQSPSTDPKGARSGGGRVLRGGSWDSDAWWMRVSDRSSLTPGVRSLSYGFRLVREGS